MVHRQFSWERNEKSPRRHRDTEKKETLFDVTGCGQWASREENADATNFHRVSESITSQEKKFELSGLSVFYLHSSVASMEFRFPFGFSSFDPMSSISFFSVPSRLRGKFILTHEKVQRTILIMAGPSLCPLCVNVHRHFYTSLQ